MERYHAYLEKNYDGGCERFFSPTGFLQKFQKTLEVKTQKMRASVFFKSADEAAGKLQPIVEGQEGVYDLCALPGTGKTSVLPFRFPTKRVLVASPTPFDAWSAYNMASGECALRLKGLSLGKGSQVVYTDSYYASNLVLTGLTDFDILLVDECDCDRGVTKFLSEVKVPGKYLIRMSATIDEFETKKSDGFRITDHDDMPDIRQDVASLADYIKRHHSGRSMVLAPDADSADSLHAMIPGSTVVHTRSNLGHIARVMVNQSGDALYIADDTCARGLNLNLLNVFDTQLVSEYSITRVVTTAEAFQRRFRVGRNREGHYFSPGLKFRDKPVSDIDVLRHNVVRGIAEVPQDGGSKLRLTRDEANDLMLADREPFELRARVLNAESAVVSTSTSPGSILSSSDRRTSSSSTSERLSPPAWLAYFGGGLESGVSAKPSSQYIIKRDGKYMMERRTSGSSNESDTATTVTKSRSHASIGVSSLARDYGGRSRAVMRTSPHLPDVDHAPYALSRHRRSREVALPTVPLAPPLMDLTELTYDMDWPALIRDRILRGGDLPTLVPPGSWRHTSSVGLGTDWFRRLDDLSHKDNEFDDREFEIVCRAWNRLVGQAWVKRTPGLSSDSDQHRMEYCIRYFQSYFLLSSAG